VADIGGWDGYFVRRLTEDFKGYGTLVEKRTADLSGTSITHLRVTVDADTVSKIGYHDAILILSVFHHMDDWQAVYEGLKAQCRELVVELAVPEETEVVGKVIRNAALNTAPSCRHILVDPDAVVIGETQGPNGPPRPLVQVKCAVQGIVKNGTGRAAPLVAKGDFSAFGYTPFPGTLNVMVGAENRGWFRQHSGVTVESERSDDYYVPAILDGISTPIHIGFSRNKAVLEVFAPIRLRDRLANEDTLIIRPAPIEVIDRK